jgi:hypothetical protein
LGSGTVVAESAPIKTKGQYLVTATALINVAANDGVYCFITTVNTGVAGKDNVQGGSNIAGYGQAAVVDVWTVDVGDALQTYCYSAAKSAASQVYGASMIAVLAGSVGIGPTIKAITPTEGAAVRTAPASAPTGPEDSR